MSGILCYIEQFLTSAACLALYTEQYKKYIMYRRQKDEQVRSASGLKKKKKKGSTVLDFRDLAAKGSMKQWRKPYVQEKQDSKRLQQKERGTKLSSPNKEIWGCSCTIQDFTT